MNVFVLCVGRSGSNTFTAACRHAANFTAGHEDRATLTGPARVDYPADHIEVDHRLAFYLGRLDERYGDDAYYVHLTRDREACARTNARHWTWQGSMVRAWHNAILKCTPAPRIEASRDMVGALNENIRLFLKDKGRVMRFPMAEAETLFPQFWRWIGAEGDLDAAMAEFSVRHNRTRPRIFQVAKDLGHFGQRALRCYR